MVPICQRIFGAVAQLGERHVRNVEVSGSIPLGSTKILLTCKNDELFQARCIAGDLAGHPGG